MHGAWHPMAMQHSVYLQHSEKHSAMSLMTTQSLSTHRACTMCGGSWPQTNRCSSQHRIDVT